MSPQSLSLFWFVIPGQLIYTGELKLLSRLWVVKCGVWRCGNFNSIYLGSCGEALLWRKEERVWEKGDVTFFWPSWISS